MLTLRLQNFVANYHYTPVKKPWINKMPLKLPSNLCELVLKQIEGHLLFQKVSIY
jgi:hypothetical protein